MNLLYVDSSAMVKRLVDEPESAAFERFLADRLARGDVFVSSSVMTVELHRFAFRQDIPSTNVTTVVRNVSKVAVSQSIFDTASNLKHHVKTLDAIHLATALALKDDDMDDGEDAVSLVTYDAAMARTAGRLDIDVLALEN